MITTQRAIRVRRNSIVNIIQERELAEQFDRCAVVGKRRIFLSDKMTETVPFAFEADFGLPARSIAPPRDALELRCRIPRLLAAIRIVLRSRGGAKMFEVEARAISASVLHDHAFWDRPIRFLPCQDVDSPRRSPDRAHSVAVLVLRAIPENAWRQHFHWVLTIRRRYASPRKRRSQSSSGSASPPVLKTAQARNASAPQTAPMKPPTITIHPSIYKPFRCRNRADQTPAQKNALNNVASTTTAIQSIKGSDP